LRLRFNDRPNTVLGVKSTLKSDLRRLGQLAFHRAEWGADLVRRLHRLRRMTRTHPDWPAVEAFYPWLLVPLTLWPLHLEGLGWHLVEQIEKNRRLTAPLRLLLDLLGPPPDDTAVAVTMQHEHLVQPGDYGSLIHAQHKFQILERELARDPRFLDDWRRLKEAFDVARFQDRKKIIRRRMLPERNYRTDWRFNWAGRHARFQAVFDVFCWRWNLYGMRGDEPLLMQLTVNLTPYGTMIFIPAYWSFDPKRDLKWRGITALHRARGVRKQGPKLSLNQIGLREDAERAAEFWSRATRAGLRGKQRTLTVMQQMGWDPRTDSSKLRRLLKLAPIPQLVTSP
jgi:hypothetical protein